MMNKLQLNVGNHTEIDYILDYLLQNQQSNSNLNHIIMLLLLQRFGTYGVNVTQDYLKALKCQFESEMP